MNQPKTPAPKENFILNQQQQDSLSRLLDRVCPEESKDFIVSLACRFREKMDWGRISANMDQSNGNVYQLTLSFALPNSAKGYIKIYVWYDAQDNYSIGLSSTDKPDFALHRYSEGVIWESLRNFYHEMESAMAV